MAQHVATLAAYGLHGMTSAHKQAMRDLIIHSDTFAPEQRVAILRYCLEDVTSDYTPDAGDGRRGTHPVGTGRMARHLQLLLRLH